MGLGSYTLQYKYWGGRGLSLRYEVNPCSMKFWHNTLCVSLIALVNKRSNTSIFRTFPYHTEKSLVCIGVVKRMCYSHIIPSFTSSYFFLKYHWQELTSKKFTCKVLNFLSVLLLENKDFIEALRVETNKAVETFEQYKNTTTISTI